MSGGFPFWGDACNCLDNGTITATGLSASINMGSLAAHTKSAFAQVTASTASDACWMVVSAHPQAEITFMFAIDIAVGATGSETIIASNLGISINNWSIYAFPVTIPAGTKISARAQSTQDNTTDTLYVDIYLLDGGFIQSETAGIDSIGYVTSGATHGTATAVGATPNVKGSYAVLTSSTARDYQGFLLNCDINWGSAPGGGASFHWLVDIAIGATGSETVIVPNYFLMINNSASNSMSGMAFFPIAIPAGTKVSARAQSTIAASRSVGVTLYGIYQ